MAHGPRGVGYREDRRAKHNVVARGREGLPEGRDEPWHRMAEPGAQAEALCRLYGRRMSAEGLFRDPKGRRDGQSPPAGR